MEELLSSLLRQLTYCLTSPTLPQTDLYVWPLPRASQTYEGWDHPIFLIKFSVCIVERRRRSSSKGSVQYVVEPLPWFLVSQAFIVVVTFFLLVIPMTGRHSLVCNLGCNPRQTSCLFSEETYTPSCYQLHVTSVCFLITWHCLTMAAIKYDMFSLYIINNARKIIKLRRGGKFLCRSSNAIFMWSLLWYQSIWGSSSKQKPVSVISQPM